MMKRREYIKKYIEKSRLTFMIFNVLIIEICITITERPPENDVCLVLGHNISSLERCLVWDALISTNANTGSVANCQSLRTLWHMRTSHIAWTA